MLSTEAMGQTCFIASDSNELPKSLQRESLLQLSYLGCTQLREYDSAGPKLALHATMSKSVNMSIEARGNSQAMHRTGWILILGVTAWGGLWFRDPRIRALIPRRHNVVHSAALANASRSRNRAIS